MYQAKRIIRIAIGAFTLGFVLALSSLFLARSSSIALSIIFSTIGFDIYLGTLLVLYSIRRYSIPLLSPRDYADKSFSFCPIKCEGEYWLATLNDFIGPTVAISRFDFSPDDMIAIENNLQESIETGSRIEVQAYGYKMRGGYILILAKIIKHNESLVFHAEEEQERSKSD